MSGTARSISEARRVAASPTIAFEHHAGDEARRAELAVARRLRRAGCELARDVPLPSGRTADFAAVRGGVTMHVHVKWLAPEPSETAPRGTGRMPRVLRGLESIARPIELAVRWRPGAGCSAFGRMVREVTPFVRTGRVSEERVVRDARGREIGRVRVLGPRRGTGGVVLVDERLVRHREAQAARAQRLLRKALAQFMPRSVNVIVVAGADPEQTAAIEHALLGSVVECWDRFPPRGQRVAHGRADDGFWSRGRSSASRAVAWIRLPGAAPSSRARHRDSHPHQRLWLRDGAPLPAPVASLLRELFGPENPAR